MYTPSDPQTTALLGHVVSQVQQNVEFLVSENYISEADGSAFLSKLPNVNPIGEVHQQAQQVETTPPAVNGVQFPVAAPAAIVPPPVRRGIVPPPPPGPKIVRARALWGYNENDQMADDLSFSAGDIIEIVTETSDDWWMGKLNGRQALFPSSYVEKIQGGSADATRSSGTPVPEEQPVTSEKPVYKPFGAVHHGNDAPPPAGDGEVNSVGLQQDPGQAQKKGKYGKFGNTMAHSAAGGVGFGAGAAIGGGLIRAIF